MIINADDLGMTPGTNRAIFEGYDHGAITHTSIMANADYFEEAIEGMQSRGGLGLGMHLNLTYGKALVPNPLFCDENGIFNLGYGALLKRSDDAFMSAVEKEFEAQIRRVLEYSDGNRRLTHIDSHRHIHLIPHLYPVVAALAKKYEIPRVRLVKENFLESIKLAGRFNFILNGGIVKYMLLRSFSIMDAKKADLYGDMRFYSILYTGVVGPDILKKLAKSRVNYEIMIHPGYPEMDRKIDFYDEGERAYRVSEDRRKELETVLSMKRNG